MLGLRLIFVAFLCAGFANADDLMSLNKFGCLNNAMVSGERPLELKIALNLQQNYKLVVRYTDHLSNNTAKISEFNFTDTLVIRKEQNGIDETFIVNNKTINYKNGECSSVDSNAINPVYNITDQLRTLFKNPAASMVNLLTGINNTRFDAEKLDQTVKYVDGVNVASWTGCLNQTKDDYAVEIVVDFATEKSKPSYSDYANPKVVSVKLIVFKVDNWTNATKVTDIKEHTSLNLVELEHTRPEHKQEVAMIPRGLFCNNMTWARLPAELPSRFQTNLEYVDTEKRVTDKVDLSYDETNKIVSFALDFDRDSDVPYVQNSADGKIKGKARVVQDFKSGFEYLLSRDGRVCNQVGPIQKTWSNVQQVNNMLILRDPTTVFLNISQQPVYYAGQVVEEGVTYNSYVSRKLVNSTTKDYIVVELLFTLPDWTTEENKKNQQVHSIVQYHKNANHTLIKKTVVRFNALQNNNQNGISWVSHGVQSCLLDVPIDNFFFFKMDDVTMKNIQEYGYMNVENALAGAIAQTTNISVLRVSQFLFKNVENELLACFLLGEKNNGTPAQTTVLLKEKTIQEVRQQLNDTLKAQKIVVSIITDDLKEKKLSLTAFGTVSTKEHIQPTPYYGYSGGSMFILGIFAFIFGASAAVGSYVLYMKRQQVRGIAYQVFE